MAINMRPSQSANLRKKELILILGGARSGKSSWALRYAEKHFNSHLFVATARATDPEMEERIRLHRESRGKRWKVVEEPIELPDAIATHSPLYDVLLIDCLTVWLNNIIYELGEDVIEDYVQRLIQSLKHRKSSIIIVSNEVGFGIVPDSPIARRFRDECGSLNQRIGDISGTVILMVAGFPMFLKKGGAFNEEDI